MGASLPETGRGADPDPWGVPGGDPVAAGQTAEMMAHAVPVEAEQG